ncbi:MAG: hypothetical protein ABTQ26_12935, partial [Azonexus sp.]
MTRRNLIKIAAGAAIIATATMAQPALAAGVSADTQKELAAFLKAHPEMKDELMPGEQDCLDGKRKVDTCEAEVKRALVDMKKEVAVNAKEAQLNAKEAQLKIETEMTNRLTLTTVIGEMNNRIQYGKGSRTGIPSLA